MRKPSRNGPAQPVIVDSIGARQPKRVIWRAGAFDVELGSFDSLLASTCVTQVTAGHAAQRALCHADQRAAELVRCAGSSQTKQRHARVSG